MFKEFVPCGFCGICMDVDLKYSGLCWYDPCNFCDQPRFEHRYALIGCGRDLDNFVKKYSLLEKLDNVVLDFLIKNL